MRIFTHPLRSYDKSKYLKDYEAHRQLNNELGFFGTLIFTSNNDPFDPFTLAQWLCESTNDVPLIALNPAHLNPYVAAWRISSISKIYNRSVAINWITGASKSELNKLGDELGKDERYSRLKEHFQIVNALLTKESPITFRGDYFQTQNAQISLKPEFEISHFLAGESNLASETALKIEAEQLVMARKDSKYSANIKSISFGLIVENTSIAAVERASNLFQFSKLGKRTLDFSKNNTDSSWKERLIKEVTYGIDEGYTANALLKFGETPFIVGSKEYVKDYLQKLPSSGIANIVVTLAAENDYRLLAEIKDELNW